MGIRESLLNTITSVGNSDFVRIVTSAGASSKATVANLFKSFESGLSAKSSLTDSDYIRVVGSDNNAYKQSLSGVMNTMGVSDLNSMFRDVAWRSNENLNDLSTTGIYWISTGATNTPRGAGTTGWYPLMVIGNGTTVRQIIATSENTYYTRKYQSGSWSAWEQMPTRAEMNAVTPVDLGNSVSSMESTLQTVWDNGGRMILFQCASGLTNILTNGAATVSGKGVVQLLGDPSGSSTSIDFLLYTGSMELFTARYSTASSSVAVTKKATMTNL